MNGLYLALLSLFLIAAALWLARRWGREGAERDLAEKEAEHARKRHQIDETVSALSDDDLDTELERMRRK